MNADSVEHSPAISRRRADEQASRRKAILDAAESVFGRKGYHETSITEIAGVADLATGTIYLYFQDKSDLYGSLIVEKMQTMRANVDAALASHRSARRCLRNVVQEQFAFHDANRPFFEIFLHHHQLQTSPLHEAHWKQGEQLKRDILTAIERRIREGQGEGEIRSGDPKSFAVAFLGMMLQMIRQWIRDPGDGVLVDRADFVADCFLHGAANPRPRK